MGVIDEVKQKIDIVEVIGEYTPLTKRKKPFFLCLSGAAELALLWCL